MPNDGPNEPEDGTPGFVIKPPPESGEAPDKYTKQGPSSYIPDGAPNQVFKFSALGVDYGTDDKAHAAAVLLSAALLVVLVVVFLIGSVAERTWIGDAIKILGTAFTFTVGVAIGQGTTKDSN